MKVFYSIESLIKFNKPVVTSGTFDGVHIGHQKILNHLKDITKKVGGESIVITYFPHPRMVLFNDSQNLKLINTLNEKIELLAKYGVDNLLIIPFTREFSEISSEEYINQILVDKIGTNTLVIGYDHRFGKNREGSFEYLSKNYKQFGFYIDEIPRQDIENIGISSTIIRNALLEGKVNEAQKYLGTNYSISGQIVKGKQIGRTIGYPTANIRIPESYKLIPADGVYAVYVNYNEQTFGGMLNIGKRPTIDGQDRTIEVNILGFEKEIYGETLQVSFVEKIRNELKFSSLEELKVQIGIDKIKILEILNQKVS